MSVLPAQTVTAPPAVIRVMVVEDDPRFRRTLEALFGGTPGFACLGAHATAEAASRQLKTDRPHVLLVDYELPGRSGVDLLREVLVHGTELPAIVLTVHQDPHRIFAALEAGASGYLVKPVTPLQVLGAVEEVHAGGAPMSAAIARLVLRRFRKEARDRQDLQELTERELEVLRLTSEGLLPEEVGERLGIAKRTVTTHLQHVYAKLHVRTRAQAVAKYLGNPKG